MPVIRLDDLFPAPADTDTVRGPLPKQREFMDLVLDPKGPTFVGYYGGYGSGKSFILCITMLIQGIVYGGEYVIARAYSPELRRTTWKQFLDLVPKELLKEVRVADAEIHVKSQTGKAAIFYFTGLDEPQKLDSLNLSGWGIDEASQTSEEAFLKLQGRLRNRCGLRKGIVVGNPKGKNWVYRRFVSKESLPDPLAKSAYKIIVAPSTENIHLPPDYIKNMLASYSRERIQRDVYGSWDSFEGMVYTEFDRAIHVIAPFDLPKEWTRIVGADHGYTNPAAFVWGAVDYDGAIYVYQEYYQSEKLISELATTLVRMSKNDNVSAIYIDPSTKATRGQTGASDFDSYLEHIPDTIALLPAKNEVSPGIDRVKSYLKLNEKTRKPRLYIFNTCVKLIDEVTQYQWEELGPGLQGRVNEKEKPKKYNDHAVDALRYLVMSRPDSPSKGIDPETVPWNTAQGSIAKEMQRLRKPPSKDPFGDF